MSSLRTAIPLVFGLGLLATTGLGCESAIVGSECRPPLVRCGRYCVDLTSDGLNCGMCGNACSFAGTGCVASTCQTLPDAATFPDTGARDAGRDGGRDGGSDAGDDAGMDAFVPDAGRDAGDVDAGGPRCGLGELLCGSSCVDPRLGTSCGDCTTTCSAAEVCASGACAASCGSDTACGTRCVDTDTDPHHCGDCTTDCGTGACVGGTCATADDGHLVLIGHDFETHRMEMSQVLANAVLLPTRDPARVLVYEGTATSTVISGVTTALGEAATAASYVLTTTSDADGLGVALENTDTLLVLAQSGASDAALRALGFAWGELLDEFLDHGGTVIVLDAPSLSNGGTWQLLDAAGLFRATASSELVNPRLVAATGRESDAVVAGITFPYSGERHTVRISTVDPDVVITTGSAPVVFHRVLPH